jgi:peptidoglycan/LPS O-acetylase OafA/YrhL
MQTHSLARIYFGSDTGAAPLMLGSAAGLLRLSVDWTPSRLQWLRIIGVIGLAVTAIAFLKSWSPQIEYSGVNFALEVGVACAVLGLVVAPVQRLADLLALTPLVLLGRISYGVYLWQGVILMLLTADFRLSPVEVLAVGAPMTILISLVSYRFVERPFLTLKNSVSMRRSTSIVDAATNPSKA